MNSTAISEQQSQRREKMEGLLRTEDAWHKASSFYLGTLHQESLSRSDNLDDHRLLSSPGLGCTSDLTSVHRLPLFLFLIISTTRVLGSVERGFGWCLSIAVLLKFNHTGSIYDLWTRNLCTLLFLFCVYIFLVWKFQSTYLTCFYLSFNWNARLVGDENPAAMPLEVRGWFWTDPKNQKKPTKTIHTHNTPSSPPNNQQHIAHPNGKQLKTNKNTKRKRSYPGSNRDYRNQNPMC